MPSDVYEWLYLIMTSMRGLLLVSISKRLSMYEALVFMSKLVLSK